MVACLAAHVELVLGVSLELLQICFQQASRDLQALVITCSLITGSKTWSSSSQGSRLQKDFSLTQIRRKPLFHLFVDNVDFHIYSALISDIRNLLSRDLEVRISHTYKEGLECFNHLGFAPTMNESLSSADLLGLSFYRYPQFFFLLFHYTKKRKNKAVNYTKFYLQSRPSFFSLSLRQLTKLRVTAFVPLKSQRGNLFDMVVPGD